MVPLPILELMPPSQLELLVAMLYNLIFFVAENEAK
jgi:hypothetical protein